MGTVCEIVGAATLGGVSGYVGGGVVGAVAGYTVERVSEYAVGCNIDGFVIDGANLGSMAGGGYGFGMGIVKVVNPLLAERAMSAKDEEL